MPTTLIMILFACVVESTWPNHIVEARRGEGDSIVAVTNPSDDELLSDLVVASTLSGDINDRFNFAGPPRVGSHGPVAWGVYQNVIYLCTQMKTPGAPHETMGQCRVEYLNDRIVRGRLIQRGENSENADRFRRQFETGERLGTSPMPLVRLQGSRGAYLMSNDIPYWFDITYSEETDLITLAIVCEGVLEVSTCEPGLDNHDKWTTVASVPTRIDGPFQVLHANGEQFVIDSSGDLFVGLDENHARIGSIPGFPGHSGIKATLLFEDRDSSKIGVIQVTRDDAVEVIAPGSNDQRAVEAFMTDLDDDGLRRAFVAIADVVDEGRDE